MHRRPLPEASIFTRPPRSAPSPPQPRAGQDRLFPTDAPFPGLRWCSRYRSIRLTTDGVCFIVLAIGIGAGAVNTGNNLLYLVFAMMLSLIIVSGILSERCFRQLQITRRLPSSVCANEPVSAAFVLMNRKRRVGVFSLRFADVVNGTVLDRDVQVFHLPPCTSTVLPYPIVMTRRGRYEFEEIKLTTRFPFGFFVKAAFIPCRSSMIVYPEIKPLPGVVTDDLVALGHEHSLLQRGQGTALHNLRVYQPGDDSRAIHWRTTARRSQLIVRETEAEDQRRLTLVLAVPWEEELDTERRGHFERAISLVASLAVHFTREAYEIRLLLAQEETPYGMGEAHLSRMLVALALCQPAPGSPAPAGRNELMREPPPLSDELRLVVLPWSTGDVDVEPASMSRLLVASELH